MIPATKIMSNLDCENLEAPAARLDDAIRFDKIPHTTPLFVDFLYNYGKVAKFYSDFGRQSSPLAARARYIGSQPYDRQRVPDALERINRRAGSPDLTFKHIDVLRRPGSVAVVTGQQAGLFTGPLYTIHKAITAIKLASCLQEQGVDAVPVFWIASEDHDYEEVNHCKVIDTEGALKEIRYDGCGHKSEIPIGQVRFCEGIEAKITELVALLPRSEFTPEIERDLRETYRNGEGFAGAFAALLARLFKNYGVVLLDPLDQELRQVAAPLYSRAIEKSAVIAHSLVQRSAELTSAGYHGQVHVSDDMVPLFIIEDERRVALVRHGDRFVTKDGSRSFSQDELVDLINRCSDCFSPNVTFRPVVQDYLIPTAAYIGGPAEIAYFAQIRAVYETLERPLPCVLPRASFTLIEGRHQKSLRKYSLELADFFDGLHPAITKVVEQGLDRDTAAAFTGLEQTLEAQFGKLETALGHTDPTLVDSAKLAREKIRYQVEHLRTRFVHAAAHREESTYRQIERACTSLYPDRNLQEREINVFYFLARYGPALLDELYAAADVGFSNHKLVNLGGVATQVLGVPGR